MFALLLQMRMALIVLLLVTLGSKILLPLLRIQYLLVMKIVLTSWSMILT